MVGNKHFLGFMLLALLFVVSCTSKDFESEGLQIIPNVARRQSRAMHCTGRHDNIDICQNADNDMVSASQYYALNSHLLNDTLSTGSYVSYYVCNTANSCLTMSTLTSSKFNSHKYRHITEIALKIFDDKAGCHIAGSKPMRLAAFEIYLYEYNFLYSWSFEGPVSDVGRCG